MITGVLLDMREQLGRSISEGAIQNRAYRRFYQQSKLASGAT
jgi:hypothetical protein